MTSVVGILNKRGVALAADSAVTRKRYKENGLRSGRVTKCTKNGNKMIRISETVPVAVMITGNAEFLETPWDVIVRRYRQKRGEISHATVEDVVTDFFKFISETPVFWNEVSTDYFLNCLIRETFRDLASNMSMETQRDEEGVLVRPAAFRKSFIRNAREKQKEVSKAGVCPQFRDYALEDFRERSKRLFDIFLSEKEEDAEEMFDDRYPREVISAIRPAFEEAVLAVLGNRNEDGPCAELIFAGYGADQDYPSLVPVNVCEGYDFRVGYNIRQNEIVNITDSRPVAICPFAQDDVIKSVLRGIYTDWSEIACNSLREIFNPLQTPVFEPSLNETVPEGFQQALWKVESDDLIGKFFKEGIRMLDKNQREWERALKDYDLEAMAALADSLIDLTGFQRILTFSQEGVGGTVDLAVISKSDGFNWIRRKNWYHKDNGLSI